MTDGGHDHFDVDARLTRRRLLKTSAFSSGALFASGGLGALLAACGGDAKQGGSGSSSSTSSSAAKTTGTTTGISADTIKIGMTASLTGPFPLAGRQFSGFFERMVDTVNKAGGVNGRQIKITTLDDGADAQRAIGNVQRLIRQEQVFALTALGTGTTAAFLKQVVDAKVPLVFPGAFFYGLLNPPQNGVYALFPLYEPQLTAVTKWAYGKFGPGKAVIVRSDLPIWDTSVAAAQSAAKAAGGSADTVIKSTYTQPEWGSTVIQIKKAKPDYVIFITSAPAAGACFKEMMRQKALPAKGTLGFSTTADQAFLDAAGHVPDNTIFGAVPATVLATDPAAQEIQALWPEEQLGLYGVDGATAGKALTEVLKQAGKDVTRESFVKLLGSGFGPLKLPYAAEIKSDPSHLMAQGIGVATTKDGKFTPAVEGFV